MADEKKNTRNGALDLIKGVCIVLVVFGHLPKSEGVLAATMYSITAFVYKFHVPFFLVLAGYFHSKKVVGHGEFIKVIRRLAIPYLATGCLFIVSYSIAGRFGVSTTGGAASLTGLLCGHGGGALWFVYTLMLLELAVLAIEFLLVRIGSRFVRSALLVAGVAAVPFAIDFASGGAILTYSWWMCYLFFAGYFSRQYRAALPACCWGLLPMLPLWLLLPDEGWNWARYALVPLFLSGFVWLAQMADKSETRLVFLTRFLGRHTMPIMLYHPLFITLLKIPFRGLLHHGMVGGILYYLGMTVAVTGLCLATEMCLDKVRLSFLMGKPN